jgi:hypothetical protein
MASTIAAITTGTGGVVTAADASGNLSLLSGATTVVAVTATGASVTGTLAVSGTSSFTGAVTLTGGLNTPLAVLQGGTGVTTSTGTGAVVLGTSPTLVTPILGTPTSGNLANCTGIPAPAALSTASGSAPSYSARAWCLWNASSAAITASGNVASVARSGVGYFSATFTTAMADANYSTAISARPNSDVGIQVYLGPVSIQGAQTASTVYIRIANGSATAGYDTTLNTLAVFR